MLVMVSHTNGTKDLVSTLVIYFLKSILIIKIKSNFGFVMHNPNWNEQLIISSPLISMVLVYMNQLEGFVQGV